MFGTRDSGIEGKSGTEYKFMSTIKSYRELRVWQNAMNITQTIYELTRQFPSDEKYGLVSQIRRAAVSIASNIAEGNGRNTTGEYIHFLGISRGSLFELETQIEIASRLGFLSQESHTLLLKDSELISKQLTGLIKSLNASSGFGTRGS